MKVYSSKTGQEAKLVQDDNDPVAVYMCYLRNRPSNEDIQAHKFERLGDAAKFLLDNSGSGIRMDPGHAIASTNIVIER